VGLCLLCWGENPQQYLLITLSLAAVEAVVGIVVAAAVLAVF